MRNKILQFKYFLESVESKDSDRMLEIKDCFSTAEVEIQESFIYRIDYNKNVEYSIEFNDNIELTRDKFILFIEELQMAISRCKETIDGIDLLKSKIRISTRNDSHQFDISKDIFKNKWTGGFKIGQTVTILDWWIVFQGGKSTKVEYNLV